MIMRATPLPLLLAAALLLAVPWAAAADGDYAGWEIGSEYNDLYNPKEMDQIKGDIVRFISITPLDGMAEGVALVLDEGGGDTVVVHLCPESFANARETGLKRGDWVKIRGVWADIGDETVFLASKVKKDNGYSFKVRLTSDGTPFWTLTPERLAYEQSTQ